MAANSKSFFPYYLLFLLLLIWSGLLENVILGQEQRIHRQRPHPSPEIYTTVRSTDPTPSVIAKLSRSTHNDSSRFLIHHVDITESKTNYTLLILVESLVNRQKWRTTIRETWSRYSLSNNVLILFFIPISEEYDTTSLKEESAVHQDMILFTQVSPSDFGSGRFIHYMYWVLNMFNFSYLLRTRDNYFIKVDKILENLSLFQNVSHLYMGYFNGHGNINEKDRNFWIHCPSYTPYAYEGAYLISSSLIERFLKLKQFLNYYHNEGASISLWCSPYKDVTLYHDININSGQISRGCLNSYIITPTNNTLHMKELYYSYVTNGICCQVEYEIEQSYHYNWTKLPSQCCEH